MLIVSDQPAGKISSFPLFFGGGGKVLTYLWKSVNCADFIEISFISFFYFDISKYSKRKFFTRRSLFGKRIHSSIKSWIGLIYLIFRFSYFDRLHDTFIKLTTGWFLKSVPSFSTGPSLAATSACFFFTEVENGRF